MVVCPCSGARYMFEIVKTCKISLPAQDQVSGERYRTIAPLVIHLYFLKNKIEREQCPFVNGFCSANVQSKTLVQYSNTNVMLSINLFAVHEYLDPKNFCSFR